MPAPSPFNAPTLLTDPGYLWGAPIGTAEPTPTVTAGLFADALPAAWIPFGPTSEGTTLSYSTTVEAIRVAEFFDPIRYSTTERNGSIAFALANWTLSNFKRALNGGMAALTSTGGAGLELTSYEPPDPGTEVRVMIVWESFDKTVRMLFRQCIQGGEVSLPFQKAPSFAPIPCTFNFEIPTSGSKPFKIWTAGTTRVS
jgi:hypothetical protein